MACLLTAGIAKACKDGIGGVTELYLANHELITAKTLGSEDVITGLTATGTPFFKFAARKEQISFEDKIVTSDENGTTYNEGTINYPLTKIDKDKRLQVGLIAVSDMIAIVKDGNNIYHYFGDVNGVVLSEGTATSGKAFGDKNGYDLTLMAKEPVAPYIIDYAAFSSLIG